MTRTRLALVACLALAACAQPVAHAPAPAPTIAASAVDPFDKVTIGMTITESNKFTGDQPTAFSQTQASDLSGGTTTYSNATWCEPGRCISIVFKDGVVLSKSLAAI